METYVFSGKLRTLHRSSKALEALHRLLRVHGDIKVTPVTHWDFERERGERDEKYLGDPLALSLELLTKNFDNKHIKLSSPLPTAPTRFFNRQTTPDASIGVKSMP